MTPDTVERAVADAARRASGLADVPAADVRRAPSHSSADYTSPLPTRLASRTGTAPERLAAHVASLLGATPGITAATATSSGFVEITVTPAARFAVLAAATGWDYLSLLARDPEPPAGRWPRRPLHHAANLGEAADWARADARERIRTYCTTPDLAAATSDLAVVPPGIPTVGKTWRDSYLDAPSSGGEVDDLLSVVGEAAVRIAACAAAQPAPTAARPGAWERQIMENPAFALRYAHAHAHTSVFTWGVGGGGETEGEETGPLCPAGEHIATVLFEGPGTTRSAHHRGRPSILVRYLEELAAAYREWTRTARVAPAPVHPPASGGALPGDPRLVLSLAVAGVLGTGLFLLGVSAPTEL